MIATEPGPLAAHIAAGADERRLPRPLDRVRRAAGVQRGDHLRVPQGPPRGHAFAKAAAQLKVSWKPVPTLPDTAIRPDEAVRRAHLFGATAAAPAAPKPSRPMASSRASRRWRSSP